MSRNLMVFRRFLKNAVMDRGFAFWTIMYPLLMVTIFYFGFSGVMNTEFQKSPIGVSENHPYIYAFDNVDIVEYEVMNEEDGVLALQEGSIIAYVKEDGNMLVSRSDPAQTAVKEVLDAMKQFGEMAKTGISMDSIHFDAKYTTALNQPHGGWKMTFYSIIAMISVYSIFTGIQVSKQDEFTSRIAVSPFKKSTRMLCYFLIGLLVNMAVNVILVLYIQYVLRLNLFPKLLESFAIIACGNIFGVAVGILFGIPKKLREDAKMSIAIGVLLMLTTLAGMMGRGIPRTLEQISPWIPRLNPIAAITNLLMRVNLIGSMKGYLQGLTGLALSAALALAVSFAILWRRKYERD